MRKRTELDTLIGSNLIYHDRLIRSINNSVLLIDIYDTENVMGTSDSRLRRIFFPLC